MLKGIDISNWQRGLNIASTGAEFVIIKATQGTGYVDPSCDVHYQSAKALGKKLGVYHYASGGDPIAEADFFVDNTKGYHNEAILVLDWESNQNARFNEHASWCLAFLARVYQRTGIKGVIYMSASVIRAADWSALVRNDYGLWVAGYPDNRNSWDIPDFPYSISPWSFFALWQYTSSAGTLDRNIFTGDQGAWDRYANVKVTVIEPTPVPVPVTPTLEPVVEPPVVVPVPVTPPTPVEEPIETPTDNNNNNDKETDMSETPTTPTTNDGAGVNAPDHNRGLSTEEFAALQAAGAFTVTDGFKPTIPDNIRLAVYLASGIGTPLVALIYQMLAVYGIVTADLAVQVITIVATFFGTIAGLFGISHFTKSK